MTANVFLILCMIAARFDGAFTSRLLKDDIKDLRREMEIMKQQFGQQIDQCRGETAALKARLDTDTGQTLDIRSDDIDPLAVTVARLSSDVQLLQAKNTALEAQMARMETPLVLTLQAYNSNTYNTGDIIKFSQVLERAGITYDSTTGIATVPQAGTYVIYVRVDQAYDADHLWLTLNVNGVGKVNAFAEHGSVGGVTVALRLQAGDRVWVSKHSEGTTNRVDPATMLSIVRVSL